LTIGKGLLIPHHMDRPPPRPTLTDRALAEKQAREAREAAALRANLLRRKQQQRARAGTPAPDDGQEPAPACPPPGSEAGR